VELWLAEGQGSKVKQKLIIVKFPWEGALASPAAL
jgi:hypothetical protein